MAPWDVWRKGLALSRVHQTLPGACATVSPPVWLATLSASTLHLHGGLASSTAYARCLLELPRLWGAGLPGLALGQSVAYYRAALLSREKASVVPDQALGVHNEMLKHSGGGAVEAHDDPQVPALALRFFAACWSWFRRRQRR